MGWVHSVPLKSFVEKRNLGNALVSPQFLAKKCAQQKPATFPTVLNDVEAEGRRGWTRLHHLEMLIHSPVGGTEGEQSFFFFFFSKAICWGNTVTDSTPTLLRYLGSTIYVLRATPHGNDSLYCGGSHCCPTGWACRRLGQPCSQCCCRQWSPGKNTHCQKFPHGCIFVKLTQQIRAKLASYRDLPMLMFRSGSQLSVGWGQSHHEFGSGNFFFFFFSPLFLLSKIYWSHV